MRFVATAVVIGAVLISGMIGRLAAFACSSDDEFPGSLEDDLCEYLTGSSSAIWLIAVLWPAIVFGVSQTVPRLGPYALVIAITVSVPAVALWVAVLAVVG